MSTVTHCLYKKHGALKYLPEALQHKATLTLWLQQLRNKEGAKDPGETKKDVHTPPQKTGKRVTTLRPLGLASYRTCCAATTGLMEKVSICLWVTSWELKTVNVVCDDQVSPAGLTVLSE